MTRKETNLNTDSVKSRLLQLVYSGLRVGATLPNYLSNSRRSGNRNRNLIGRISTFFVLVVTVASVRAAPPFVAGYDRFAESQPIEAGRLLLTELGCTACHPADGSNLNAKSAPILDVAGRRLSGDWVKKFLSSPQHVKPGTTMPDMFAGWDGAEKQNAITALIAFLTTKQNPYPKLNSTASTPIAREFWSKGDAGRGEELYHQVGCVACHEPRADGQTDGQTRSQFDEDTLEELGIVSSVEPLGSVPHPQLHEKYSPQSLTHFVLDPLAVRPDGRMPSLKLRPDEAADVAAYLLADQTDQPDPTARSSDANLIATGRRLFQEIGCVNCHEVKGVGKTTATVKLVDLDPAADVSCIGKARTGLPHYTLDDSQRSAIRQAIADPQVDDPVQHRMMQLNCYACHERNNLGGVGLRRRQFFQTVDHVDLGDEGRIPPPLDGVGRKLTNTWLKNVLTGKGDVRPYLETRMPIFGSASDSLVDCLIADDLQTANAETAHAETFATTKSSGPAGRTLFDLGCVQCHPLQGERLPGVVGIDLAEIDKRVRPEWFRAFLLDPAGLKQRTRMPTFFRNGQSSSPDVLSGNVDQQIASLWVYLKEINKHGMPAKIEQGRAHDFELVPEQRPIILRTFMEHAGPQAIAVGFPDQLHLAFDAESVRIAQFWKGRFLDAHGTWFNRFTPPAKPLGSDVVNFPVAGAFALSPSGETARIPVWWLPHRFEWRADILVPVRQRRGEGSIRTVGICWFSTYVVTGK